MELGGETIAQDQIVTNGDENLPTQIELQRQAESLIGLLVQPNNLAERNVYHRDRTTTVEDDPELDRRQVSPGISLFRCFGAESGRSGGECLYR